MSCADDEEFDPQLKNYEIVFAASSLITHQWVGVMIVHPCGATYLSAHWCFDLPKVVSISHKMFSKIPIYVMISMFVQCCFYSGLEKFEYMCPLSF